jgi:hypothetical protein
MFRVPYLSFSPLANPSQQRGYKGSQAGFTVLQGIMLNKCVTVTFLIDFENKCMNLHGPSRISRVPSPTKNASKHVKVKMSGSKICYEICSKIQVLSENKFKARTDCIASLGMNDILDLGSAFNGVPAVPKF